MTQSFSLKEKFCKDVSKYENDDQVFFDDTNASVQKSMMNSHLINLSQSRKPPLPLPHLSTSEASDIVQKSSLDLFNSSTAVSSVQALPAVALVITGLKDADVRLVKLFCQRFSVSLLDRISSETTHLVVKTDRKNRTARTFKYLQAIVNSICVIPIEWVQACIDANEILNEVSFHTYFLS